MDIFAKSKIVSVPKKRKIKSQTGLVKIFIVKLITNRLSSYVKKLYRIITTTKKRKETNRVDISFKQTIHKANTI